MNTALRSALLRAWALALAVASPLLRNVRFWQARALHATDAQRWAAASVVLGGVLAALIAAVAADLKGVSAGPQLRPALLAHSAPPRAVRDALSEFAVAARDDMDVTGGLDGSLTPDLALEDGGEDTGPNTQTVRIDAGDTLSGILQELGATREDAAALITALRPVYDPRDIKTGQEIEVTTAPGDPIVIPPPPPPVVQDLSRPVPRQEPKIIPTVRILNLTMKPAIEREIRVERDAAGQYAATEEIKQLYARQFRANGVIDGSLILSATRAQIPLDVTYELIRIFSYDVDFQRDLRVGDAFEVFFTRYYDDAGNPVKEGEVLMGAMTLSGKRKALYRFTPADDGVTDYFDERGYSAKKFLMRTPVDGARVTSGFGMRRHPILGYSKMHRGIDFGAPTGTPVMAAGNGVVEMAGWNGGYGKYVRIKHANGYATAYAHLSRYGQGVSRGGRVRQGQIIGYVGSTGRSTGPHLHYEVMVNGQQVNPASAKLPTGRRLEGKHLEAFDAERARLTGAIAEAPSLTGVAADQPPAVDVVPAQGGAN